MWVGWDWSLAMRKGKEAVGLERRRPQGDASRLLGVCHRLTLMLCRSRRVFLQSRWEHWPGKEPQSSALCCVPSPSVAGRHLSPRGKRCSWGSRGQCAASLLWKRENALTGLSTGEMVSSQEYNLQGKTKKCPLRFPFSFKQKIIIIKKILRAKENETFSFVWKKRLFITKVWSRDPDWPQRTLSQVPGRLKLRDFRFLVL